MNKDKAIIKEFKEAMDKRRSASRPPRRGKVPPHRRKTRKKHLRLRPQRPRPNRGLLLRTPKPPRAGKIRQRRQTRTRPDRRTDRRFLRHTHAKSQIRPARAPHPNRRHPQHAHPPQPARLQAQNPHHPQPLKFHLPQNKVPSPFTGEG